MKVSVCYTRCRCCTAPNAVPLQGNIACSATPEHCLQPLRRAQGRRLQRSNPRPGSAVRTALAAAHRDLHDARSYQPGYPSVRAIPKAVPLHDASGTCADGSCVAVQCCRHQGMWKVPGLDLHRCKMLESHQASGRETLLGYPDTSLAPDLASGPHLTCQYETDTTYKGAFVGHNLSCHPGQLSTRCSQC